MSRYVHELALVGGRRIWMPGGKGEEADVGGTVGYHGQAGSVLGMGPKECGPKRRCFQSQDDAFKVEDLARPRRRRRQRRNRRYRDLAMNVGEV